MSPFRRSNIAAFGWGLVLAACSFLAASEEELAGGSDEKRDATSEPESETDAGADASDAAPDHADAASDGCPQSPGPVMVPAGTFCIDSTEVTNAHYLEFLNALDAGGFLQQGPCAANDLHPDNSSFPGPGLENYPVNHVDWCDAFAYCKWAGKRLCGRIGGGPLPLGNLHQEIEEQWYAACTHAGERKYPYPGDAYLPVCNAGWEGGAGPLLAVKSRPECQGGYPGLYDMIGNVREWEDLCDPKLLGDSGDPCATRGEDNDDAGTMTCKAITPVQRHTTDPYTGFRCCAP